MDSVRESWTDERLDDLSKRMGDEFRDLREEMRLLRTETSTRFEAIDARLDGIHRVMVYGIVSLSTAMLAGLLAIATQL